MTEPCICPTCGFEHSKRAETKPILEETLCPECNGPMISRKGQYGTFWGCKKYPECRGTRDSQGRSKQEREAWKEKQKVEVEHQEGYPFSKR